MIRRPPRSTRTDTLFPYTTLFRSSRVPSARCLGRRSWAWTIGGSFLRAPPTREPCFVLAAEPPLSLVGAYLGPLVVFTARLVIDALAVRTDVALDDAAARSEEPRVGKGCVSKCKSRWSTYH